MEPILRVQNLTKTFTRSGQSNLTAVNGISFDLLPGDCLGIIGESGSGKTTAVNLITRLLDATEGRIFLDGEDITRKTGKPLRMIYRTMQMAFQTPTDSFDPRRTLGDGIGESLRNCGMTRHDADAQAARLLERCGLPAAFAGRYPHEVSGGQCQRAAIARALAVKPKVLICDEATSALDTVSEASVQEALDTLMKKRTTIIIAHRLSTVRNSDMIVVLQDGVIAQKGKHADLLLEKGVYRDLYAMQLKESTKGSELFAVGDHQLNLKNL